jgi:hypothetical protein
MIIKEYEAAERQLAVVRSFRNPAVEAVKRLKEAGVLVLDKGMATSASTSRLDGRERDRRKKAASGRSGVGGGRTAKSELNLKSVRGSSAATETKSSMDDADADADADADTNRIHSRPSSRGRSARAPHISAASAAIGTSTGAGVRKALPRRQGSHDDIGLSRSQGSYDTPDGENEGDGACGGGTGGKGSGVESGLSAEMEMMRRMWESRDVYDRGVH